MSPISVQVLIDIRAIDARILLEVRKAPPAHKNAPKAILTPFVGRITVEGLYFTLRVHTLVNDQPVTLESLPGLFQKRRVMGYQPPGETARFKR